MSEWQKGDLALCVSHGPDPSDWREGTGGPALGSVHAVVEVKNGSWTWLHFVEWPSSDFLCLGFRKIIPLTVEEADEFVRELLTDTPAKEDA